MDLHRATDLRRLCLGVANHLQIDVDGGRSGLVGLEEILDGIDDLAFVRLTSRDVVRHKIVQDIVDAYDRHTP